MLGLFDAVRIFALEPLDDAAYRRAATELLRTVCADLPDQRHLTFMAEGLHRWGPDETLRAALESDDPAARDEVRAGTGQVRARQRSLERLVADAGIDGQVQGPGCLWIVDARIVPHFVEDVWVPSAALKQEVAA